MTTAKRKLLPRDKKPTFGSGKPIILTKRDKAILHDIDRFHILTTAQISALHFQTLHRTRKRLRKLWLHGFVKRFAQPVQMGKGSAQFLFAVTPLANLLISRERRRAWKTRVSSHALDITTFRICIEVALRTSSRISLVAWLNDRAVTLQPRTANEAGHKRLPIVPDGFFVLKAGEKQFGYFLEIDRGTADLNRVKEKCLAYLAFWKHKGDLPYPNLHSFRVLYVAASERRVWNILQSLRHLGREKARTDIINVAWFGSFSLQTPTKLFSPIWHIIDCFNTVRTILPLPALTSFTLPIASGNPPVREPNAGAR